MRATPLEANAGMSCVGYQLSGQGFAITADEAASLGLGHIAELDRRIKPLVSGSDITRSPRGELAIDLFGLDIAEVQARLPEVFQWIYDRVKPERDLNNRASVRERWWIFGEARSTFRPALAGLSRVIATSLTAKHRTFAFFPA